MIDMEFEKVKEHFGIVEANTTAALEHVGEIKRGIRFLKEFTRCIVCTGRRASIIYLHNTATRNLVIKLVTHLSDLTLTKSALSIMCDHCLATPHFGQTLTNILRYGQFLTNFLQSDYSLSNYPPNLYYVM